VVEPRGVGRRETQLHSRMVAKKSLHLFGLVRREMIEDQMDAFACAADGSRAR
jgi:hypothetical protein